MTTTEESMPHSSLDELIAQLPERYQPIYGRADGAARVAALGAIVISPRVGRPCRQPKHLQLRWQRNSVNHL